MHDVPKWLFSRTSVSAVCEDLLHLVFFSSTPSSHTSHIFSQVRLPFRLNTSMSDAAPASVPAKKVAKKPKKVADHPPVSTMVMSAISGLKERKGSSLAAIKKYIAANNKVDVAKLAPFIRRFLKKAVADGKLVQPKGTGASGSFKMGAKPKEEKPKKVKKPAKKPASKKEKKAKKPKTPKKPKAKKATKSPKKPTKAKKSPKKPAAKKPAAKKPAAKKPAAKKPAAKKPAAKKPAAKKATK